MPHRPAAPVLTLILAAGTLTGLVGCTGQRLVAVAQVADPAAARAEADQLAAMVGRPRSPEELPPELSIPDLDPVAPDDPIARLPLAEALAHLGEPEKRTPDEAPTRVPTPAQLDAAMRLYVAGRLDLQAGRLTEAIEKLRAAAGHDPTGAAIWEALGEAHQRAGSARSATDAFGRAAALGSRDPATIFALARAAQSRGEHDTAARYLARLAPGDAGRGDPAVSSVADVALGQSLIALGYHAAGAEALARGLQLPSRFSQPTTYQQELGEIYRRRAELWRIVGDTHLRLGQPAAALDAYDRAAGLPSLDAAPLLPRRMRAALLVGRPGAAAAALLAEATEQSNRPEDASDVQSLARALAKVERDAGRRLARIILAGLPAAPTRASRLSRTAAAALPASEAADVLRAHLSTFPWDAYALADLLALEAQRDPARVARTLADLAAAAPFDAATIARTAGHPGLRAVAPSVPLPEDLIASLEGRSGSLAARLVAAHLRVGVGDWAGALDAIAALRAEHPNDHAVALSAALLASKRGRWDIADPALAVLSAPDAPASAAARAFAAAQRFEEAHAAAALAVAAPEPRVSDLLVAAEIAANLGRYEEQEQLLRRAIEADPENEAPYMPLLRLHKSDGQLPDEKKLAELVRAVRAVAPGGKVIRLLRDEELAVTGRLGSAQGDLLNLAEERPLEDEALETLAAVWRDFLPRELSGVETLAGAAEQRLAAILERSPGRPWAVVARAAAARARGDSAGAEAMLRAALRDPSWPAEVAWELEETLRRTGRVDEAAAHAAQRLAAAPDAIPNLVEAATRELSEGELAAGAELLSRLPAGTILTPAQAGALAPRVERACRAAMDSRDPDERAAAAAVLGAALAVSRPAPPQVHAARLRLLVSAPEPDVGALRAALEEAARQHPASAAAFYSDTARRLAPTDPAGAMSLAEHGAAAASPPNAALHGMWVLLALQAGTPADAVRAFEAIERAGLVGEMLKGEPEYATAAELAYHLGVQAASDQRDHVAIALYEAALQRDPTHGWANNNLGYTLLEREGPTDRAAELIEAAYRALPEAPNVLDSIGWLRYHQGVLEDQPADGERPAREGAVTLLTRALTRGGDPQSPVVLDHLGDALWMTGQFDAAVRSWRDAEHEALRRMSILSQPDLGEGAAAEARRMRALARHAQSKQAAAVRGGRPAVAPIAGREVPIWDRRTVPAGGAEGENDS